MPASKTENILWRGRRVCQCVIDAVTAAEKKGVKFPSGVIYQGGYNKGGVSASAGTHDRGGVLDTFSLSNANIKTCSAIGLWPNNRVPPAFIYHNHMLVFGCPHMASGLKFQESELRADRNGLANRGRDPHKALRPAKILTFKQWVKAEHDKANAAAGKTLIINGKRYKPISSVNVKWIADARKAKVTYVSRPVYYVQSWLRKLGYYKSTLDGKWGPVTQAAFDRFRSKTLRLQGSDAKGAPGVYSTTQLGKRAGSKMKVVAK